MTHRTVHCPAWLRAVGEYFAAFQRASRQQLEVLQTRNTPRPLLPLFVTCATCPASIDANIADDHGRCVSCSAIGAAASMTRDERLKEKWRLEREQLAAELAKAEQVERAERQRGALAPPRKYGELASVEPFDTHATEALPELVDETASVTLDEAPLDYVALGYVAAAVDDDDATLRAQIMLSERHDVPGLMAGIAAGLSAFEAHHAYLAFQAAQKDLVSA